MASINKPKSISVNAAFAVNRSRNVSSGEMLFDGNAVIPEK